VTSTVGELRARAVEAAVAVAAAHGVRASAPTVLADRANLVVHLSPAPVVARVATTTALVRSDPAAHVERELAVAHHLRARGAPVVPPADAELPPGPHVHDGLVLSFWIFVAHTGVAPHLDAVATELPALHAALADFAGVPLPVLGPLAEVADFIDRLARAGRLTDDDVAFLRRAHARLWTQLTQGARGFRPLHGDAHTGNVLVDAAGRHLWTDFEDTCVGPLAWDLACLIRRATPAAREAALTRYGAHPDELAACTEARTLQAVAWVAVLATRYPEEQARADELLRAFRATSSASDA
jgi:Phosphotransferase enzyme family